MPAKRSVLHGLIAALLVVPVLAAAQFPDRPVRLTLLHSEP